MDVSPDSDVWEEIRTRKYGVLGGRDSSEIGRKKDTKTEYAERAKLLEQIMCKAMSRMRSLQLHPASETEFEQQVKKKDVVPGSSSEIRQEEFLEYWLEGNGWNMLHEVNPQPYEKDEV